MRPTATTLVSGAPLGRLRGTRRRGDYGFDAPYVPLWYAFAGAVAIAWAVIGFGIDLRVPAWIALVAGIFLILASLSFVATTRLGKFAVWNELLDELRLRGDELVLDVGCGRGMVLLMAAQRLTSGRAIGIDIWSGRDQSGNAAAVTLANADLEGVRDRVAVDTADMRQLPFPDRSFDLVTASLALHNVADPRGRAQAVVEIWRVLKPGGVAMIVDFRHLDDFQVYFRTRPDATVERRSLGWRYWYAGPHDAAKLLKVTRAGADR